jgi:DNA-binding NarL/FixJ family response regulator
VGDEAETLAARLADVARGSVRSEAAPGGDGLPGRRAVVLDQYPLWHEAVELVLARLEIEVVARLGATEDALEAVVAEAPDLLVTEIELPGRIDGPTLIRLARGRRPGLRIVALTLSDEPASIHAALAAGADAYVLKAAHPDDLATAVRQCFAHSVYLAAPPAVSAMPESSPLTSREVEILRLVAEGYSNRRLAELLSVSEPTVKFHLTNVYRKLGVRNRTEASRWAQRHGALSGGGRGSPGLELVPD